MSRPTFALRRRELLPVTPGAQYVKLTGLHRLTETLCTKKNYEFKNIIEVILFKENIDKARAVFKDRGLWGSVDSAYPVHVFMYR